MRWNAYMISRGTVPANIHTILNEKRFDKKKGKEVNTNGNNSMIRHHGNLTTFEGLVQFRKMIVDRDHCTEESADVINYDYQILDDAWWILHESGYGIVKK